MPAGKTPHRIREYTRRIDRLLAAAERERSRPPTAPPPPINEEHARLRRQIVKGYRTLLDPEDPEGTDQEKRIIENDELANVAAELIFLVRQEQALLAMNGVDYRPYEVYRLGKFEGAISECASAQQASAPVAKTRGC
jgi:hypothetical protein